MKDKIFQKLKQEYSHLGLGNGILQAHAESLASLGLVTDENIDAVVAAQKSFLTNLQKDTDSRVTEAQKKAKELGIPQWRIDEGFNIADDADDTAISEHLSKVSNNIKAQSLPGNRTVFPQADAKATKADADAVAKSLC